MKTMKNNVLRANGYAELSHKMAQDYLVYSTSQKELPNTLRYKVKNCDESTNVLLQARIAAFKKILSHGIKKVAFDTRRIDQENTRNPRENLQYWVRTDQFINEEMQSKIDIFSKILKPLNELKMSYGHQPEWHGSYTRTLLESVNRILRIKEGDLDIFQPQLSYLEQLIFARYRLDMEQLSKISDNDFKDLVLKKDENLIRRGVYLNSTGDLDSPRLVKGIDNSTQQGIINAIFGNTDFRKDGERIVERTITITIRDEVK